MICLPVKLHGSDGAPARAILQAHRLKVTGRGHESRRGVSRISSRSRSSSRKIPGSSQPDQVMLRMLDIGICGTDKEICSFEYGTPPAGDDHLVIGHESLAEIVQAGTAVERLQAGDLVVPSVRRPCPHPDCLACRSGHQDYCYTGDFRERGIKEAHGYMTEYVGRPRAVPEPRAGRSAGDRGAGRAADHRGEGARADLLDDAASAALARSGETPARSAAEGFRRWCSVSGRSGCWER